MALLAWARTVFSDAELAGMLAATSICFDLSVFELLLPLTTGGSVIVADNVVALPELPARNRITCINTVPSAMRELMRMGDVPASVRTVCLAGEPLTAALVDDIYATGTVERVYDLYGPSEDTTYSTWCLREPHGVESIGRPIANTQAYVLDAGLQPVPVGVAGELYLGGEGVARGYLCRAELTDERFLPHPIPGRTGRVYRTGDLARYLDDGRLQYLGRIDHQVKIRGFRVELVEIDAVLAQHDAIREVVTNVHQQGPDDTRLTAYYVLEPDGAITTAELRKHLRRVLPAYMIPQHFVELDAIPLTPNRKIDRKALPAPDVSRIGTEADFVAPRSPDEEVLAGIWAGVLRLDRVGTLDDFFALGGHSLLAMRVIARVRDALQVEVPLRALFEGPTVAALAQRVAIRRSTPRIASPSPPGSNAARRPAGNRSSSMPPPRATRLSTSSAFRWFSPNTSARTPTSVQHPPTRSAGITSPG